MSSADVWNILGQGAAVALFLLAHVVGLLLIPLALPGLWLQVVATLVMTLATGRPGLGWTGLFAVLALVAEIVEFLSGRWGARRYGGSSAAGWGALLGGLAGALIGGPIPILGSILMSFVGTFAGALLGEMYAVRTAAPDLRVGYGAVVGRVIGVATKLAMGFVMLSLSVGVLVVQAATR
jgi:uncharacterized protein YqgC (DUF456 family)